jgi:hypothetical protein
MSGRATHVSRSQLTPRGVFGVDARLFSCYSARVVLRDRIVGGVPKDPQVIEGWLRAKAGIEDAQEVRQAMLRTLSELGADTRDNMSFDDLVRASEALATSKQTTGFKVGDEGLYIEGRQVKSMLKESTNVLFGGERWGATKKGPRAFVAERVFVEPDRLWLGVREPTGIDLMIGHVSGPTGPRSTLGYHEYVEGAELSFRVLVVRDCIAPEQWAEIWLHAQESGLGALRSQGYGRFNVEEWNRLD